MNAVPKWVASSTLTDVERLERGRGLVAGDLSGAGAAELRQERDVVVIGFDEHRARSSRTTTSSTSTACSSSRPSSAQGGGCSSRGAPARDLRLVSAEQTGASPCSATPVRAPRPRQCPDSVTGMTQVSPQGLHHVTAIAADPQSNVDFYTRVLGLRLVKQTVNFDAPDTYHLYYGDEQGSPSSLLTFFPWPDVPRGRQGAA